MVRVFDLKEKVSLSSLTNHKLDQAFAKLKVKLLEFISIPEGSREYLFDYTRTVQDPSPYSFSVLAKNGSKFWVDVVRVFPSMALTATGCAG